MSSLKNGYKVFKICQKGVFNLRIENKNTWRLFNEVKKNQNLFIRNTHLLTKLIRLQYILVEY